MTRSDAFDLDGALARLAAEAEPGPALKARVLADAAMVSAERRPAPAAPPRRAGGFDWLRGWRGLGLGGAFATLAVGVALGLGGFGEPERGAGGAGVAPAAGDLAGIDGIEREIIAAVDDEFFDAPL